MKAKLSLVLKILALLSLFTLVQGCVTYDPIPQEQWEQMVKAQHFDDDDSYHQYSKKTYTNVTPEEILSSSKKIFELMDEKDVEFIEGESSLSVKRRWMFWALVVSMDGNDFWNVSVHPSPDNNSNTDVTITVATQQTTSTAGASFGAINTSGVVATVGGGTVQKGVVLYKQKAVHELFWARLDYMLGLSKEWITCKKALVKWATKNGDRVKRAKVGPLCRGSGEGHPEESV